jgi:hypothetical protein
VGGASEPSQTESVLRYLVGYSIFSSLKLLEVGGARRLGFEKPRVASTGTELKLMPSTLLPFLYIL